VLVKSKKPGCCGPLQADLQKPALYLLQKMAIRLFGVLPKNRPLHGRALSF
jgi:hypothetical protein